jgi:DNA-binding response OmpR family regulator
MAETLLVVEDEPHLLALLRRGLEQHAFRVLTATDGPAAIAEAAREPPDLIVLDLMLPGLSGLDVCRALREQAALSQVPIIFLTARHETRYKVAGLDLGGDDYVTKPFDFGELVARIRARLRARHPTTDGGLGAGVQLLRERHELRSAQSATPLTPREFDLLELLVRHPNQVLLRSTIAQRVWGDPAEVDSNVLDVYIRRLRRKLQAVGGAGRIRTARGDGYLFEPPRRAS